MAVPGPGHRTRHRGGGLRRSTVPDDRAPSRRPGGRLHARTTARGGEPHERGQDRAHRASTMSMSGLGEVGDMEVTGSGAMDLTHKRFSMKLSGMGSGVEHDAGDAGRREHGVSQRRARVDEPVGEYGRRDHAGADELPRLPRKASAALCASRDTRAGARCRHDALRARRSTSPRRGPRRHGRANAPRSNRCSTSSGSPRSR